MISIVLEILNESWVLLLEMAPYLLFGLIVAGILHGFLPSRNIYTHLAGRKVSSVVKASLVGIPLPLCSCSVIPVAAHLQKQGAGKGSVLSFLISTPTSGVDSILATYSLMGWLFTIMRIIASFFSGIFAGVLANLLDHDTTPMNNRVVDKCVMCDIDEPHSHAFSEKLRWMTNYAFHDLVKDIGIWLLIGILIGGIISYVLPEEFGARYLGNPLLAYALMLLIGTPLYVCATASIPIAASLILKGLTPGAALVFLFVGPATNTTTLAIVGKLLGRKSLAIYLIAILFAALGFGFLLDLVWTQAGEDLALITGEKELIPMALKISAAFILVFLIARVIIIDCAKNHTYKECTHC